MLVSLYRAAAAWTAIGLAGGLFYRDFTKVKDFVGTTQLSLVHTHALALGMTAMLVLLALAKAFELAGDRRFGWAVRTWNVGLAVTVGSLFVKGILQVNGSASADSPAIAGVSGLGHITLTVAAGLLFHSLGRAVRTAA